MVSTKVLVGIAIGVAGALIAVVIALALCLRNSKGGKKEEEDVTMLLLPAERGSVMPRVNPDVDKNQKWETALMNARFYLRSRAFALDKLLPDIGRGGHKQYFRVTQQQGRSEFVMAMTKKPESWPIPLNTETARVTFSRIVKSLEGHPYVSVPVEVDYMIDKDLAVAVRPLLPKGSLKDFIHKAKPLQKYSEKYQNDYALNPKLIGKFGRQILEGLSFLKFQGFPYYHLHTGNVLVFEDNICCLSDIEDSLVGIQPPLTPLIKPLIEKVDPDVVCFGCVLFEMAVGYELETIESFQLGVPQSCPAEIKQILEAIFNPWFGVPPTLEELLKLSLFADVKIKKPHYQRIQYNTKEKEMIAATKKCMLARITETVIDTTEFAQKKKKKQATYASFSDPNSTIPPLSPPVSSSLQPISFMPSSNISSPPAQSSNVSSPPPAPSSPAAKPPAASSKAPPPPKAPPAPPPPSSSAPAPPPPTAGKSALLSSITGFKGGLKKTTTVDKSAPVLSKK